MNYVSFGKRLASLMIDITIVAIITNIVCGFFIAGDDVKTAFIRLIWSTVIFGVYSSVMESSKYQATLGQIALRSKVCNLAGEKISFAKAFFRYCLYTLSGLVFPISAAMVVFTKKKQALHDKLTASVVVKA